MSFVQDAWDDLTGKSAANAAKDAAGVQADYAGMALDETRRQYDESVARLLPFLESGLSSIPDVQNASTAGGLNDRLAEIMGTSTFGDLVSERGSSVVDQLSRGGLTRSGYALKEAADIPADLALAIENTLYGRAATNVGNSQNAAAGLGSLGAANSSQISNLLNNTGSSLAQGIIGSAQAGAAGTQNLINTGLTAAMFFSDPRLKENMQPIGEIGGLTLYEWDWIEGVSPVIGEMNLGFDADEVAEKYPGFVEEIHGFKAVNYHGLIDELKEAA